MNGQLLPALNTRLCRQIRHPGERLDVLGTAVRVTAIVKRVDAQENIAGSENLRPRESNCKKNGVPRRNIGNRNALVRQVTSLRNVDVGCQGRPAEGSQVDRDDLVLNGSQAPCYPRGRVQLYAMALSIIE